MVLLLRMRLCGSQVFEYFSGQTQSSPGGQGLSQVPVGHTYITLELFRVLAHGINHGPPHVFHDLSQENGFNLHGGLEAAFFGCSPFDQSLLPHQIQRRGQLGWLS